MAEKNTLLLWERLFPESENQDVADALRSEVRDPLWLLARQWQLGEFKGEDAGTAASTHVIARTTMPQRFSANGQLAQPLPTDKPLDAVVESIIPEFDLALRMEISRKWRQMLFKAGKKASWDSFCQNPLLQFKEPALIFDPDNPELRSFYHEPYAQSLAALGNARAVDGSKLFKELHTRKASEFLSVNDAVVDALGEQWKNGVYARIGGNNPGLATCWDANRLEYQAKIAAPLVNGEVAYLEAPEHNGQKMAWYDWDKGSEKADLKQGINAQTVQVHRRTVVPTAVSFPSMPRARWWEMEDSTIDLSNIQAQKTDTGLLLLAEFSLLFSNDWLLIPLSLPIGTLTKIQSLRVADVFGVQTILKKQYATAPNPDWQLFQMTESPLTGWTWLPPVSTSRLQGEALEEIKFIRDEMANMVWAVEQIVPDGIGGATEGASSALGMELWLRTLAGVPVDVPMPDLPTKADYIYTIGNTVAPHWIPFIPFRPIPEKPDMVLRRAAMPRILEGVEVATRIRPHTALVQNSSLLKSNNRLDIREEEIPATGLTLRTYWRRSRWLDGTTVTWLAREKRLGRTSEVSGLQFDILT